MLYGHAGLSEVKIKKYSIKDVINVIFKEKNY